MLIGAGLGLLALPVPAGAHVTVQPNEAPAQGLVVENVRVPNERDDASTSKVAVQLPDGFAEVSIEPVPGWNAKAEKTRLAQPITTDEGDRLTEQVSRITWTGGRIAPGEFQEFRVSVQIPDKAGSTLTFKAIQTYDDGRVVRWIGPEGSDSPAPQVKVTAAADEGSSAASASDPSSSDDDSNTLAIIALVLGGLGVVLGGGALLARRRAAP